MVPRCHGAMVPWCLGATVPWFHGATAPRCLGAMVPLCHGATLPRCDGDMVPCCQGALVPRCHGATAPWCRGALVPCRIPLVRTSSELAVRRAGKAPEGTVPSPSPGRHAATRSRRGSSSSSPPTADGFGTGTPVPSPQSQSFSRSYGSILPTSLAYIVPSTRGCSPWRPDAVMSTTGRGRHSVLRIFKGRRERTGHHATCGALPAAGPYLRLSRFQAILREAATRRFDLSFAPIPKSDERFARQYRCRPSPKFPLASPRSSLVHPLSGPDRYAHTRTLRRRSRSVGGAPLGGIPPISFLAPYGFTRPLTRTHVRLFGPCFKTARMGSPQASRVISPDVGSRSERLSAKGSWSPNARWAVAAKTKRVELQPPLAATSVDVDSYLGQPQARGAREASIRPVTTAHPVIEARCEGAMRCVTPRQTCRQPNGFGCNLHSKTRWFMGFCNSHQVSYFATFFIDARAKISVAESHFFLQKKHRSPRRTPRMGREGQAIDSSFDNDPSAGSPTETLLRLLLPLNDKVQWTSRDIAGSEPPTSPRSKHFTGSFNR
ncbi:hypothetical protein T459_35212 [Capsicum annuum]|uniref:Uncharacterized protein n=1 Tax=Capsicum annuum TaxID=4072 RepID=A0A2G2XTW0_CAPAN|nr:hypothetical protein T459_35212 [Capsicum annuum]